MKSKALILLAIIISTSGYCIWKNSTMEAVDFDTVYAEVENWESRTPLEMLYEMETTVQYDKEIDTLKELYEEADVVAVVHPVSRKQEVAVVNTRVEIKECFKSDYEPGQQISIFEQYYMRYYNNHEYPSDLISTGDYIPMDMDKDYFVFLKNSEEYTSDQYGVLSLMYGKFPYLKEDPSILQIESPIDSSIKHSLKELLEYDVVVFALVEEIYEPSSDSTKELAVRYAEYKENYLKMLDELVNNSYQIKR